MKYDQREIDNTFILTGDMQIYISSVGLPAADDPDVDRDAHGENNQDPSREDISDAGKTKGD